MKRFNTTAVCVPELHYMVDLSERVAEIKGTERPIVLIIDEVDTASNNQVFLDFLGQLRADYLAKRRDSEDKTFKSVILVMMS